jgi:FlaA1/EpsC-like NDP-sugar epimerase
MSQRTVLSDVNDIRVVAKDISIFSCRKRIFKAKFHQFTDSQNIELEKIVVRYYSLIQQKFWNTLPGYTLITYLLFVFADVISFNKLGLIPIILLYIPFAFVLVYITRIAVTWYAKRSLLKLANDLELQNSHYSFVMSARQ